MRKIIHYLNINYKGTVKKFLYKGTVKKFQKNFNIKNALDYVCEPWGGGGGEGKLQLSTLNEIWYKI